MLQFSSRQENANCMQINDMIHVIIWHSEQWLGEWELSSTRHHSAMAKNIIVRGGKIRPFSPFTQCERWPFHTAPAPGAEKACGWPALSNWLTHPNSVGCQRCWQEGEMERPQIIPPLMEENVRFHTELQCAFNYSEYLQTTAYSALHV